MSVMQELPELAPSAARGESTAARLRVVPAVPLDFDEAVRRLTPRLRRYATRRLGDAHEAEELVQEALLRAYQHRAELPTEDDVAAWTTVVTGRLVIDRLRVRGRSINVAEVPEGRRVGRDTADVVVGRDEARLALDALDAMPARQAAVLWAREVEGAAYGEIGVRFGMTEPAVRSILTRARKGLRKEFALRGGTVPLAGLSILAPWVGGMRLIDRLRSSATRVAAPAALGVLGIGLIGGSLASPLLRPATPLAPATTQAVVSTPVTSAPVAKALVAAAGVRAVSAPTPALQTPTRVPTLAQDGPLANTCISYAGAGAGGSGCATGADPKAHIYLNAELPDNPTGIRAVGVATDRAACAELPTTPLTTCKDEPTRRNGDTR